MIWMQAIACFFAWIAYGLWLRRSSERLRKRMGSSTRRTRTLLGSVGLLLGLALLGAGLWGVSAFGGLGPNGLEPWAWAAVTVIGAVFVHLQVLGAAAMVSLVLDEVTVKGRNSSAIPEKEQK